MFIIPANWFSSITQSILKRCFCIFATIQFRIFPPHFFFHILSFIFGEANFFHVIYQVFSLESKHKILFFISASIKVDVKYRKCFLSENACANLFEVSSLISIHTDVPQFFHIIINSFNILLTHHKTQNEMGCLRILSCNIFLWFYMPSFIGWMKFLTLFHVNVCFFLKKGGWGYPKNSKFVITFQKWAFLLWLSKNIFYKAFFIAFIFYKESKF